MLARQALDSPEALQELCGLFIASIFNYVLRRVGGVADAEDITSTVFEKVIGNLKSFDPAKASFKTWIYRIALNCITDFYRARGRKREQPLDEQTAGIPGSQGELERLELFMTLAGLMRALPKKQQEAVTLRYFGGMSVIEVAQVLGVTETAVSKRILRGLDALRKNAGGTRLEEMV